MISEIIWHDFNHDSTETEHVMNFKKWSQLMVLTTRLKTTQLINIKLNEWSGKNNMTLN